MKVLIIPPQGPVQVEEPEKMDLDFLQKAVGGYVEVVGLDGATMWLWEEAKLQEKVPPQNPLATRLLHEAGGMPWDMVVGTAVITGPPDDEGNTTEAPEGWVSRLSGIVQ